MIIKRPKKKRKSKQFQGIAPRSNGTYINSSNCKDVLTTIESGAPPARRETRGNFVSRTRDKLLKKKNRGESIAIRLLDEAGLRYTRERVFHDQGKTFFMDFLVNLDGRQIALEVYGAIHERENIKKRDAIKDVAFLCTRWIDGVLRIKTRQIALLSAGELVSELRSTSRGTITRCSLNNKQ